MDQGQNHVTESLLQANPTSFATVSGVEQQNLKATKHSKRIETEEKKEPTEENEIAAEVTIKRKSILDRFGEKLKEFLDNA